MNEVPCNSLFITFYFYMMFWNHHSSGFSGLSSSLNGDSCQHWLSMWISCLLQAFSHVSRLLSQCQFDALEGLVAKDVSERRVQGFIGPSSPLYCLTSPSLSYFAMIIYCGVILGSYPYMLGFFHRCQIQILVIWKRFYSIKQLTCFLKKKKKKLYPVNTHCNMYT